MTPLQAEQALITWGRVYGQSREQAEDRSPIACPLERIAGRKPRSRGDVARRLAKLPPVEYVDANGETQRLARPRYAIDPMPATETRTSRGYDPMMGAAIHDDRMDPVADAIERAWLELYRVSKVQALCLRAQYCLRGLHRRDRAAWVSARVGRMCVRTYARHLAAAREWMACATCLLKNA